MHLPHAVLRPRRCPQDAGGARAKKRRTVAEEQEQPEEEEAAGDEGGSDEYGVSGRRHSPVGVGSAMQGGFHR